MLAVEQRVEEVAGIDPRAMPEHILRSTRPLLLKGLVAQWPAVEAGRQSVHAAVEYLKRFYTNATVGVWIGTPQIEGRFFYNEDMTGFNYQAAMVKLDAVLDRLTLHRNDACPPAIYVGSTTVDTCLPGFRVENDLGFGDIAPLASIWIGNRGRVAAHYDLPDNVACVVAGRRRFTLFPPEQLENLYVGPLDVTPAGQAISLVDFARPDLDRFPRFAAALEAAQLAEMQPGDAIFIPSMWWHHVEALDCFNVLVNYWWRKSPAWMGTPANVLMHALLSIRDLPDEQREAWRNILDYYVFGAREGDFSHIPADRRGILGPISETMARRLRAELLNRLNR